jgi:hypothetical protein
MPTYVQHAVLGRIPDVFNAEAIWQAPGLALFSRRPLLRDLLERSPREHKGRATTRCFSHVTLVLPQEDIDDDYHLTRGARARDLAQTLTTLHQKDFGDLLGSDQVRYDVVGNATLAPDEIEVRFGHAVYLPAPDEKILYNISVSRDSAIWHPVCAIYPNQRLALIGGAGGEAAIEADGWPFGPDAALLVLNDGPDAPPVLQMRPKGAFDCRYDPLSGYYVIKSLREPQGGPRLLLKVARTAAMPLRASAPANTANTASTVSTAGTIGTVRTVSTMGTVGTIGPVSTELAAAATPAASARPAVWQSRPGAAAIDLTAVPLAASHKPANRPGESDVTYAPVAQQRVSLVALALPRLSRYRDTGAQALELPFNSALALSADGQPAISLSVDAADNLYASTAEGRQRIEAPARNGRPLLRPGPACATTCHRRRQRRALHLRPQCAHAGLPAPARFAAFPQTCRWRQQRQRRPHWPVAQCLQF